MESSDPQPKVAVVDDDPDIRKIFRTIISYLGYSPFVFDSGTSFVESIEKDNLVYDLALMDYTMPGMTGIEAARIIRRYHPNLKIILVTAYDFLENEARANGLLYVRKPVSVGTISRILKDVLGVIPLLPKAD